MTNKNLRSELAKFNELNKSTELEGEVINTLRGGYIANCPDNCGFKIGCDQKCRTKNR